MKITKLTYQFNAFVVLLLRQIIFFFCATGFLVFFLTGCGEKVAFREEIHQINKLEDSLKIQLNWIKSIDRQLIEERSVGIGNDLLYLEAALLDTSSTGEKDLIEKYKDLDRIYKFIIKKVKWLDEESKRSLSQLNMLREDMKANLATPVQFNHPAYKNNLTMVQKNRIHLQDEVNVGKKLISTCADLKKKNTVAEYAYLNLSIKIRNLIDSVKSSVNEN